MNISDPLITVFAFPHGLNGLEWSTTVPAADHERLARAQADARLIEEAAETDRKYGAALEAKREQIRIIDELHATLEALRSASATTPPTTMTDAEREHYARVKAVYDSLIKSSLPLDQDQNLPQE